MKSKKIPLTRGKYALVDAEDYEWLMQWKWYCSTAGRGYASRASKRDKFGKQFSISMHRVILGAKKGEIVDHINHNTLDNRKRNLRICTRSQNSCHKYKKRRSIGVRYDFRSRRNPYQARIGINGKRVCLGSFKTWEIAARAYDEAAMKYHGEFACLNFPNK